MIGFIEVTAKGEDELNCKRLINVSQVRRVSVFGRGDRASTMLEMTGFEANRWFVTESYDEVKALIAAACTVAPAPPQSKGR